jgi:iron-sulfur cluster repair protein YtfE (RIC family)
MSSTWGSAELVTVLRRQHRRIETLTFRLLGADKVWHVETTQKTISELAALLQRHMSIEDTVMFPLFDGDTGVREEGLTARLHADHLGIEAAMEYIVNLANGSAPHGEIHSHIERLDAMLASHVRNEEWVVFEVYARLAEVRLGA